MVPLALTFSCLVLAALQFEEIQVVSDWYTYMTNRIGLRTDEGELRRFALDYGIGAIADNPFFGIGYTNFPHLFHHATGHEAISPHNDFLEAFAELGMFGGVTYLVIVVFVMQKWRLLIRYASYKPLIFIFLLLIAYLLIRPMQTLVVLHLFFFYVVLANPKKKVGQS